METETVVNVHRQCASVPQGCGDQDQPAEQPGRAVSRVFLGALSYMDTLRCTMELPLFLFVISVSSIIPCSIYTWLTENKPWSVWLSG